MKQFFFGALGQYQIQFGQFGETPFQFEHDQMKINPRDLQLIYQQKVKLAQCYLLVKEIQPFVELHYLVLQVIPDAFFLLVAFCASSLWSS